MRLCGPPPTAVVASTERSPTIYWPPPRTQVDPLVIARKKTLGVVGRSGGVDSSAIAALQKNNGAMHLKPA